MRLKRLASASRFSDCLRVTNYLLVIRDFCLLNRKSPPKGEDFQKSPLAMTGSTRCVEAMAD